MYKGTRVPIPKAATVARPKVYKIVGILEVGFEKRAGQSEAPPEYHDL